MLLYCSGFYAWLVVVVFCLFIFINFAKEAIFAQSKLRYRILSFLAFCSSRNHYSSATFGLDLWIAIPISQQTWIHFAPGSSFLALVQIVKDV